MAKNKEHFIERARKIHGDEYDYSKVEYINSKTKVCIICKEHGEFWQTPSHHYLGEGCPKCRYIKSANSKRRNVEEVIELSNKVHNFKYDYSLIKEYKNDREKLPIICKEHGVFYQTMNNHIKGKQGCPECGKIKCHTVRYYTNEEFIDLANKRHNNFYSYEKVKYVNSKTNVTITCPIHGDFEQIPRNHLFGAGCPKCFKDKSKVEKEILSYIKTLTNEEIIENDRTILEGKEIDIFIPSLSIGIEVNGLIWHSEKFESDKYYHLKKTLKASQKCIRLIHIFEDEWNYKLDICKSRLMSIFNKIENKIYARKCEIKEVDFKSASLFLSENHIQGATVDKFRFGLYFNDELVSLMTFGKLRKNLGSSSKEGSYELLRFCNKLNTTVIGGASKLFKHFIKKYSPNEVISYCDKRWSDGNMYEKLSLSLYNESPPSYYYVINKKRYNRFLFRKDVLIKKYDCPKDMSEHEFCLSKEWFRIYDCGCLCYKWENNLLF